jgi:excisionase family DNA binding protein
MAVVAAQELTVRQAAKRAGRSEETIRRWIWSGRLPAVKRGTSYRIGVMHLEQVMVEFETGGPSLHTTPNQSMLAWLDELAEWKRGLTSTPGISAVDLLLEDRRARR